MNFKKNQNRIKDMTEGNPVSLIISFMLPLAAGQFLQQFYVIIDAAIVGQALGVDALAGIGATDWLYWLFLWTAAGFGQGFAIPVAIYFGEKDYNNMKKCISKSILLSGIIGILLTAIGISAAKPLLILLDTPATLMNYSHTYLSVLYGGICVVMMYNMLSCILRALGDGKTPFVALLISSCFNIAFDLIFIIGFDWGVAGAGLATVLAQLISVIYSFGRVVRIRIINNDFSSWWPDIKWTQRLLSKGMPMAFQMIFISLGGIIMQYILNQFGVIFVAGFAASNKLIGVLEAIAMSLGYSMTTYMGQNYGADRLDRIRSGMKSAIGISVVVSAIIGIIMLVFGKTILMLFISGDSAYVEAALDVGFRYLCVMSIFLIFLHLVHVYRQSLAGLGNTFIPMMSGFMEGMCRGIMPLILTWLAGRNGLYFVEISAWIGGAMLVLVAYYIQVHKIALKHELRRV